MTWADLGLRALAIDPVRAVRIWQSPGSGDDFHLPGARITEVR
jgi:hypothetical protein